MTIDFVEIHGWMYEIVEHAGAVECEGDPCDGYVNDADRQIVYSSLLTGPERIGFVARAVSETSEKLSHPAPLRMATISC